LRKDLIMKNLQKRKFIFLILGDSFDSKRSEDEFGPKHGKQLSSKIDAMKQNTLDRVSKCFNYRLPKCINPVESMKNL
jgi:hypothetical protein